MVRKFKNRYTSIFLFVIATYIVFEFKSTEFYEDKEVINLPQMTFQENDSSNDLTPNLSNNKKPNNRLGVEDKSENSTSNISNELKNSSLSFTKEETEHALDIIPKIIEMAETKDWSQFLLISEELANIDSNGINLSLLQAILNGAETYIIIELLNRGASIRFEHLYASVIIGNIETVNLLTEYGLDINILSEENQNIVYYGTIQQVDLKMFLHLLHLGAEPGNFGHSEEDALSKGLSLCSKGRDLSPYISLLLKFGAKVDAKHELLAEYIVEKNAKCQKVAELIV